VQAKGCWRNDRTTYYPSSSVARHELSLWVPAIASPASFSHQQGTHFLKSSLVINFLSNPNPSKALMAEFWMQLVLFCWRVELKRWVHCVSDDGGLRELGGITHGID
jgi:hypothetical protein